jgi:hypothetical protein
MAPLASSTRRGPGSEEGLDRLDTRVDQDGDEVRSAGGRGGDERELVAQLARVLDDADHGPRTTVERQG